MKISFAHDRLLAVMAHPDDTELLCAGTLARAKADGADVGICVMCSGDKGSTSRHPAGGLVETRKAEMSAAAALLGADLHCIGCPDGELEDSIEFRRLLIEVYRRFRPSLVLAHSSQDYHADHRVASQIAEAASWYCASTGHVTKSAPVPCPPALWWCDTVGMQRFEPAFYIDIAQQIEVKKGMLACHQSQLARKTDANFASLMDLMLTQNACRGMQSGVAWAEAFCAQAAFKRSRAW